MSSVDPTLKHIGNVLEKSASELARGINHVLAICIDEYHHQPRLYNCVKDVTDILAILTLNYGFSMDNVTELYNERATKQNILIALAVCRREMVEAGCRW
jgi:PleD family two-component response regulator